MIICSPAPYIYVNKPFGREVSKTLALWSSITPKFRIRKVTSELANVHAEIIKTWTEKGAKHYNLRVVFGKQMPIGKFRGLVKISTNLKAYPLFSLRLSGTVEGPIKVMPDRGVIFSDPTLMGGMAAVGFSIYGKNYRITGIETNMKKVKQKIIPVVEGEKYYLVLIWPGGTLPEVPYKVTLKIHTNNPIQPLVTIPVEIYTRRLPGATRVIPPVIRGSKNR